MNNFTDKILALVSGLGTFVVLALILWGGWTSIKFIGEGIVWMFPANLTNTEIVNEVRFCEDSGMKAVLVHNGLDYGVRGINCEPEND